MATHYRKQSLSLPGAIAMGTGVMVGAGIFALLGQVAELGGPAFPLAFVVGGGVAGFSAYSYVKATRHNPSAGGIAMILSDAYGRTAVTAGAAVLMALSMVLNQALVARTFGTYVLRPFGVESGAAEVGLALALIAGAVIFNLARNQAISRSQIVGATVKIGGIAILAIAAIWGAGWTYAAGSEGQSGQTDAWSFVAASALAVLAFKGFTTITNDGAELTNAKRNVGRAIIVALVICVALYALVAVGAGSSLTVAEIVAAQDYSLAEAARPVLGNVGVIATVVVAVIACATGITASMFAVSRMLTMVVDMEMIPFRSFGLPGEPRQQILVYLGVLAALLTVGLNLTGLAAVGIIAYLVMDLVLQWGVLRRLRTQIQANAGIVIAAIVADFIALVAFVWARAQGQLAVVIGAAATVVLVFAYEAWYLRRRSPDPSAS
jgi:amino acid transporter